MDGKQRRHEGGEQYGALFLDGGGESISWTVMLLPCAWQSLQVPLKGVTQSEPNPLPYRERERGGRDLEVLNHNQEKSTSRYDTSHKSNLHKKVRNHYKKLDSQKKT